MFVLFLNEGEHCNSERLNNLLYLGYLRSGQAKIKKENDPEPKLTLTRLASSRAAPPWGRHRPFGWVSISPSEVSLSWRPVFLPPKFTQMPFFTEDSCLRPRNDLRPHCSTSVFGSRATPRRTHGCPLNSFRFQCSFLVSFNTASSSVQVNCVGMCSQGWPGRMLRQKEAM